MGGQNVEFRMIRERERERERDRDRESEIPPGMTQAPGPSDLPVIYLY